MMLNDLALLHRGVKGLRGLNVRSVREVLMPLLAINEELVVLTQPQDGSSIHDSMHTESTVNARNERHLCYFIKQWICSGYVCDFGRVAVDF